MKSNLNISFDKTSLDTFEAKCEAAIRNVGRGTKKATIEACEEILAMSKEQVPKDTTTLEQSAFYEVGRRTDTAKSTWSYEAVVGYGGNGDPINPRTGKRASAYMVAVHEDLNMPHVTGKAKFLEDPVREYAEGNFSRTVFTNIKEAMAGWLSWR